MDGARGDTAPPPLAVPTRWPGEKVALYAVRSLQYAVQKHSSAEQHCSALVNAQLLWLMILTCLPRHWFRSAGWDPAAQLHW